MKAKNLRTISTIVLVIISTLVLANPETKISGYVYYGDSQATLDNVTIELINSNNNIIATTVSNLIGYYEFTNIPYGEYYMECTTNNEWNECTVLDANLVYEYLLNISPLDELQILAADVNNDDIIDFEDAQMIVDRYLDSISAFPAGDWVFKEAMVTVSEGDDDKNKDIKGKSAGDIEVVYTPPESKGMYGIYAMADKTIDAKNYTELLIPLKFDRDVELTTLSLVLTYPQNDIIVEDITSKLDGLQFNIKNGEIRIGWAGKGSIERISANEEFLFLKVKTKSGIKVNNTINFNINKISEISDASGERIYGTTMFIPNIKVLELETELQQNYPNPFTNTTCINYKISVSANVSISIFDAIGQLVYKTENKTIEAGEHNYNFDGSKLQSGMYFYRIDVSNLSENISKTKSMYLIK